MDQYFTPIEALIKPRSDNYGNDFVQLLLPIFFYSEIYPDILSRYIFGVQRTFGDVHNPRYVYTIANLPGSTCLLDA